MKILVLNGSPKGKNSVTLQTSLYLQKLYTEHEFEVLPVGQAIRTYEKNFEKPKMAIESADLIIFSYPVYTFLAPYQLHRFVELMKENGISLKYKFATQISTSKHFYDVTAHKYIEENCYDMDAKYIKGLSADMEDLLCEKGRLEARTYFDKLLFDIEHDIYERIPDYYKVKTEKACHSYEAQEKNLENKEKSEAKDVLIVTNIADEDSTLRHMIQDFISLCDYKVREINIRKYPFSGGCLGCFGCATSAKCVYKDGFDEYLRNEIQNADAIIQAFTIENHYTHSSFKCYDDRQFCNGHRTVTHGMPTGYIIAGDYDGEENVRTLVEARSQVGGLYLSGVATNVGDVKDTHRELQNLATSLNYALTHKMQQPSNFYGVGGTKIFRDLVYLMQGMMKADHKFYKENGIYDFPQNNKMKILQMKLIGAMMHNPKMQKKMKGKMSKYIIMPYTKVIEEASK